MEVRTHYIKRLKKLRVALAGGALLSVIAVSAQEATTTRVTITVTEPAGAGVANAQIRLIPSPAGSTTNLVTDARGRLSLELQPRGYGLFVSDPGFKSFVTHLEVRPSREVQTIAIVLQSAPMGSPVVYPASLKDALLLQALPYHEPVMLQPAEIKALPHTTVTVHNPDTHAEETYAGVAVATLLAPLGAPLGREFHGVASTSYILAEGAGGDEALLALAEVDPSVHSGAVLVADTLNGQSLDASSGPLKLVVTADKRPVRSVRKLVCIELKSLD